MGWSRKCEKRGKHWLRAAALGVVFLWTAGSSLQAEAESSKSAHWHKGVGVEAWLTGADKEQVSPNAASKNGAADAACYQAAIEALAGAQPVGGKLFFRRNNGRSGQVIGHHVFY